MEPTLPTRMDKTSYKDPDGFLYWENGHLFRKIKPRYFATYGRLVSSGLFKDLQARGFLIKHREVASEPSSAVILQPEIIPFVSYPFEWSFAQLKEAALLTLDIQKLSLQRGFTLKDASAYNVQFLQGRATFIDTLSFVEWPEGSPWLAYRQFCEHFLAPLSLMSKVDLRMNRLFKADVNGVPLQLCSRALSWKTYFSFGLLVHIHLHAKSAVKDLRILAEQGQAPKTAGRKLPKNAVLGLVDSLRRTIEALEPAEQKTLWGNYYSETNYAESALSEKFKLVKEWVLESSPARVWDLGANDGQFSRALAPHVQQVLALDFDERAINSCHLKNQQARIGNVLPLIFDLTNPSPGIGWQNQERVRLEERGAADVVIALALIHHLAITANIPLPLIAKYLRSVAPTLIIEFVPKNDSQVMGMLSLREDIYPNYNLDEFERVFSIHYDLVKKTPIPGTQRALYKWSARGASPTLN